MSYVTCPCGFRADTADDGFDDIGDCMRAFREHGGEHHAPETAPKNPSWAGTLAFIAIVLAVVAICAIVRWTR